MAYGSSSALRRSVECILFIEDPKSKEILSNDLFYLQNTFRMIHIYKGSDDGILLKKTLREGLLTPEDL